MGVEVKVGAKGGVSVVGEVLRSAEDLLKQIGARVLEDTEEAFEQQGLGGPNLWPPRYPSEGQPFTNVAGIVDDLRRRRGISERRFRNRPALIDTGKMSGSFSFQVVSNEEVRVGSTDKKAAAHHEGAEVTQEVTDDVKEGLAEFLRTPQGKVRSSRLGFLFHETQLTTQLVERPLVGVTPQAADDIVEIIETQVRRAAGQDGAP